MEIIDGFLKAIYGIYESSGLMTLNWQNYIMIAVSIFLLYLAIKNHILSYKKLNRRQEFFFSPVCQN